MEKFFTQHINFASLVIAVMLFMAMSANDVHASGLNRSKAVVVSFYGTGDENECGPNRPCHGSRTACGQVFNKHAVSVAHEKLPCGTRVKLCRQGKCIETEVTDRGNFTKYGREFDLSYGAAKKLGIIEVGVAKVVATVLR